MQFCVEFSPFFILNHRFFIISMVGGDVPIRVSQRFPKIVQKSEKKWAVGFCSINKPFKQKKIGSNRLI